MWTNYQLPGVFESNIYENAVNGSLWTLPVEVKAYVLIGLLGLVGLLRRAPLVLCAVAVLASLWTINSIRNGLPLGDRAVAMTFNLQAGPDLIHSAHTGALNAWARVFAAFTIGAALFSLRRWVWLRWDLAAVALAIWGGAMLLGADQAGHAFLFVLPYLVLVVAYRTAQWVRLPRRMGDYSYGVYILAFPVQQTISHLYSLESGWKMFFIAAPITLVLAALSWHLIEAPALTLKQYVSKPLDRAVEQAAHPLGREQLETRPAT